MHGERHAQAIPENRSIEINLRFCRYIIPKYDLNGYLANAGIETDWARKTSQCCVVSWQISHWP